MSDMEFQSSFSVCIIGGGVVGLAGAILLRRQGFKVTVLERDATLQSVSDTPEKPTVLALK
ncbi:hypothetical protein SAMD00023353_10400110 [Rosellinia necatrix]|uniref:FAD dependent oxidoreductase domain-containing protein n=1 Tax=Rosellinia necatrix TaxID=77044 RepID=A0A1S8AB18_ROSNE|nr:hypothetical protein SAMD00023353_10400110 [Rosellinia necatrix]